MKSLSPERSDVSPYILCSESNILIYELESYKKSRGGWYEQIEIPPIFCVYVIMENQIGGDPSNRTGYFDIYQANSLSRDLKYSEHLFKYYSFSYKYRVQILELLLTPFF